MPAKQPCQDGEAQTDDRYQTVRGMMVARTQAEISEANRRRYEELRAAGQEAAPKALPPPTALDGAPIAPQAGIRREEVPTGGEDTGRLRRGGALRVGDPNGTSAVAGVWWWRPNRS